MQSLKKFSSRFNTITNGNIADKTETKMHGKADFVRNCLIENCANLLMIKSLTTAAVNVTTIATIITEYAGAPSFSAIHEIGKLSIRMPPTTL